MTLSDLEMEKFQVPPMNLHHSTSTITTPSMGADLCSALGTSRLCPGLWCLPHVMEVGARGVARSRHGGPGSITTGKIWTFYFT